MSTKDISRFLFQPAKHYTGMRMQQGRVLLDSDYNEGAWHDDEDQRRTLLDLIGPQGSPDNGFAIATIDGTTGEVVPIRATFGATVIGSTGVHFDGDATATIVPNYYVRPGSMYIGGLRFELEDAEFIAFQHDFLQATAVDMPSAATGSSASNEFAHFFYLHGWEQCVTAIEDDEFLEHALGGPDTSVRVRRMRRVEFAIPQSGDDCAAALVHTLEEKFQGLATFNPSTGELVSNGKLHLDFAQGQSEDTCAPCDPTTTGRYLGAENQAVRIMLTSESTYVWAFDNGAPLYRVSVTGITTDPTTPVTVTMLSLPKDEEHWPLAGRVVEVLPWSALLENGEVVAGEIGVFGKVATSFKSGDNFFTATFDAANIAKLNEIVTAWDNGHPINQDPAVEQTPDRHFYVRFWQQSADATTPAEIPTTSTAPLGTTGLVASFPGIVAGRAGDFWIAGLRPETPFTIVPHDLLTVAGGVPPHGPKHFYAPLALVTGTTDGESLTVGTVEDCRRHIVPVTDTGCCTVIVGDGVSSIGQFQTIQDALDALPFEGGRVCVRPGTYAAPFSIGRRSNIVIEGCGDKTVIVSPPPSGSDAAAPLISLDKCNVITIESLQIRTTNQTAIAATFCGDITLSDLHIVEDDPNGSAIEAAQISSEVTSGLTIRSVTFETIRRAAIEFPNQVSQAKLEGLVFKLAFAQTAPPPTTPLVSFGGGSTGIVFSDSNLSATGRVGISVPPALEDDAGDKTFVFDVRLESLIVGIDSFRAGVPAQSAIQAADVSKLQIIDCQIGMTGESSEFAAVDLNGVDITMSGSRVETTVDQTSGAGPWGGVYVRKGSNIEIRDNWISGGSGHGITLGGMSWNPTNSSDLPREAEPPGKTQLIASNGTLTANLTGGFDDGGVHFIPSTDARIDELLIAGNTIENMNGNGISALTLFGMGLGNTFITCTALRVERNRVRNCLKGKGGVFLQMGVQDGVTPIGGSLEGAFGGKALPLPFLPYGGIVLPALVGGAWIRDNVVTGNGGPVEGTLNSVTSTFLPPYNGIFVLFGEGLVISGNQVKNNGVRFNPTPSSVETFLAGFRAGIGVAYTTAGVPQTNGLTNITDLNAAFPGTISEPSDASSMLFPNLFGQDVTNFAARIFGNAVNQPEGRALYVVGSGALSVENNFFASGGNNTTPSPSGPDTRALGDVVYVHNLGKPWEGLDPLLASKTIDVPLDTGFPTAEALAYYEQDKLQEPIESSSGAPLVRGQVLFTGFGGHVLFNNNQVVYDWIVETFYTAPISYFPTAVISLDHAGVRGNQFAFRLQNFASSSPTRPVTLGPSNPDDQALVANLFVLGATVDVSGNRSAEGIELFDAVLASILTIGFFMNTTVFNQGTRCTIAYQGTSIDLSQERTFLEDQGNLALLRSSSDCQLLKNGSSDTAFKVFVDSFRDIVLDRRTQF